MTLQEHVKTHGVLETAVFLKRKIDDPESGWANQFSIRRVFEAFIGPVDRQLPKVMKGGLYSGLTEAVRSQAFTIVTQSVLFNKVKEGYNRRPGILDQLVSPFPSNLRTEKVPAFGALDGPKDVPEGEEYPPTGLTDHGVEGPEPAKRGRLIEITDETIRFDRSGQIMSRAMKLGEKARIDRERRGLYAIQDVTGYSAYYPIVAGSPTQTALYRSSAGSTSWYNRTINLKASNGLTDWTNIQAAWLLYEDMKDDAGDQILAMADTLLVPMALVATAAHIINAVQTKGGAGMTESSTPIGAQWARETASANAQIDAMGLSGVKILTSPFLGDQSDTTWWLGDFRSQYYEQVIIPIQVNEIPGNPRRDIVTGFVVRYKSRVFAQDDKYVIKNTA